MDEMVKDLFDLLRNNDVTLTVCYEKVCNAFVFKLDSLYGGLAAREIVPYDSNADYICKALKEMTDEIKEARERSS